MKVSERSISAIADVVTGDRKLSRYRSGAQLVHLFNDHGGNDAYGPGFPSRGTFVVKKLGELNGTGSLASLLLDVLHPTEFLVGEGEQRAAVEHINARLRHDGYEIGVNRHEVPVLRTMQGSLVDFAHPSGTTDPSGRSFLEEQLAKCDQKLAGGDFDGAVTNARSLIEAVLLDLDSQLGPETRRYDGDLPRLFKRVQRGLDLIPARPDVEDSLKQVLSGLVSIVAGISGTSNKMGDRHARSYRPAKRHAVLVVDSAKTLANFLISTYEARQGAK